mgnify:CR=1 FL=1|tara:strand:+ start:216 stop:653 length:438 start_codon:yes stop_codon:yes gene_type:complete
MNYKEKVLKHYKIELTEDSYNKFVDLCVYRMLTADGYDIWMINPEGGLETEHNIDWEQDAFMYKDNLPSVLFDIMINENKGIEQIWYIEDVDEIFEDYEWVEEWEKILRDLGDEIIDDKDEEPDVVEDISGVELLLKLADEKHKN